MKKCPKCKAEIEENSRFCLYCMTSFEEKQIIDTKKKNRRWLYIIAAVLALVLIVVGILLFAQNDSPNNEGNDTSTNSSISSHLDASNDNTTSSEQQNSESQGNETSTPTSSNQTQASSKNEGGATNSTSGNTTTNNSTTSSTSQNNNTSTPCTSTSTGNTTSGTTGDTPPSTQPKYAYVTATFENAYPTGYSAMYAPENAIVITKVNYTEESGNYVIPDTIDGKKVAAIMPSAFSDSSISSSVKSVTLPSTVRTIWSDAFKNCYNLTDLYLKSAVIGIYEDAFPLTSMRNGELTIHCKKDCRNFDFYYYRNIANKYDAKYQEWNG